MALSYNLGYQESISVHPIRRQIFAGKPDSTFPNIWQWLICIWYQNILKGDYLWISNPSFKWNIPQCCVIHFPFNFNATASIIRPYYKRRTSNSSLYSWGDLIPQCISELLCLRSLFECYQESRLQAHSRRETKHMSPSCVVTIVEKFPQLSF